MRASAGSRIEWERQIVRAGAEAEDSVQMRLAAAPILRRAVGYDVAVMSTTDPATVLWTSCVLDGAEAQEGRHQRIFHNEYVEGDVHPISGLARTASGVGALSGLDEATRAASIRSGLLAAMGVRDELRVALRIDGACWGSFIAYRGAGTFDADDIAVAQALAPVLANAMRLAMLRHAAKQPRSERAPGVLILHPDGSVAPLGEGSASWRDELVDPTELTPVLTALLARAEAGDPHPHALVQGRSGAWLRVHVVPGGGDQKLAILEPARPVELAWTLAVAYGLTPRERTVVMGVARGLSAKEVAQELAISPWTVHDHVQSALAKVGVDSRQALVAHLFHDHVMPRREQGLHPGPWGWFAE